MPRNPSEKHFSVPFEKHSAANSPLKALKKKMMKGTRKVVWASGDGKLKIFRWGGDRSSLFIYYDGIKVSILKWSGFVSVLRDLESSRRLNDGLVAMVKEHFPEVGEVESVPFHRGFFGKMVDRADKDIKERSNEAIISAVKELLTTLIEARDVDSAGTAAIAPPAASADSADSAAIAPPADSIDKAL